MSIWFHRTSFAGRKAITTYLIIYYPSIWSDMAQVAPSVVNPSKLIYSQYLPIPQNDFYLHYYFSISFAINDIDVYNVNKVYVKKNQIGIK